jgi:argininosuccinate lyase
VGEQQGGGGGPKLWGGRFRKPLLPELERFSSSLEVDLELAPFDIAGSIAHARGLLEAGLLGKPAFGRLHRALVKVGKEIESGKFVFADSDEDIHTAVERRLAFTPAARGTTRWRSTSGFTAAPRLRRSQRSWPG